MEQQKATEQLLEVTRVTVDEVKARIDRGEPIVFIDARSPKDWGEADVKVRDAIRVPPDEVQEHLADIPKDRNVVTYCT